MSTKRRRQQRGKKAEVPAEIDARLKGVRDFIREKDLDGLLITSRIDQLYLTGFNGEDGMTLITPRQVTLLSDFRFREVAEGDAPWARFVMRKKSIPEELAKQAKRLQMNRIGYLPDKITVAGLSTLRKALKPTAAKLVRVANHVWKLRQVKDASEMRTIREAVRIAEESFLTLRRSIRVGQTEEELSARLNYEMNKRGASGPSFPIVVAEGPNSALPHAEPGRRRVRHGSAVLFDWGARYRGYRSDLTRVVFIGKIRPRLRRLYEIVLEAQRRGIAAVRAGEVIRKVDHAARSHIAKSGYGKQFGHALGHGLGLDIHEPPGISRQNGARLERGMVITIEPGIYVPGLGGVRIEDDVLVTKDGSEVLSTLPKDLDWALMRA